MKMGNFKFVCTTVALAATLPLFAEPSTQSDFRQQLRAVRAPEMPARAASLVSSAAPGDRDVTVANAVRAAIEVRAASAPAVVGAIARSTPDAAAVAAATAVSVQPKLVTQITQAAVKAAPDKAQAIVAAICKERPASFQAVGVAAAAVAPKASSDILSGISSTIPALNTLIAQAKTDLGADQRPASVAAVLKRADTLLQALAKSTKTSPEVILAGEVTPELTTKLASLAVTLPAPAPPVVGPPYTPVGPSPDEVTLDQTFPAPPDPGSRNYSAP